MSTATCKRYNLDQLFRVLPQIKTAERTFEQPSYAGTQMMAFIIDEAEAARSRTLTILPDRLRLVAASELRPQGRGPMPGIRVAAGCYCDDLNEVTDADLRRVVAMVQSQISENATVYTVTPRVDWVPIR